MAKQYAFRIVWNDSEAGILYALDAEHAERELKKLSYSMAPIRFLKLWTADGERIFVNLAFVATIAYAEVDQAADGSCGEER